MPSSALRPGSPTLRRSDVPHPDAPFDEPWQAQVFAMTVALNEAGHFSWADWAELFGPRVSEAPAACYWQIWSEALVDMLARLNVSSAADIQALALRWQEAARSTPHGHPITLEP